MRRLVITAFLILVMTCNVFSLDEKIETALLANDWQLVYNLLLKENKFNDDPIHQLLMSNACFVLDCTLVLNEREFNYIEFHKLRKWIVEFTEQYPDSLISKYLLAELSIYNANFQESLDYVNDIIAIDSMYLPAHLLKFGSTRQQYHFEEALDIINKLMILSPNNSQLYQYRGTLFGDMKEYINAQNDLSKAIELNPNPSICYYLKGQIFSQLLDDSSAVVDFSEAIKRDSLFYNAFYQRGNAYFGLREFDKAKADLERYLELVPWQYQAEREIAKEKINSIEKDNSKFDKKRIKKLIQKAYKAWENEYWMEFTLYMHPAVLREYRQAVSPKYIEKFLGTHKDDYYVYYNLIDFNLEYILTCSDADFFELDAKVLCNKNSELSDSLRLMKMNVIKIVLTNDSLVTAYIETEYKNGQKGKEELNLMLFGRQWRLMLPLYFSELADKVKAQYNAYESFR